MAARGASGGALRKSATRAWAAVAAMRGLMGRPWDLPLQPGLASMAMWCFMGGDLDDVRRFGPPSAAPQPRLTSGQKGLLEGWKVRWVPLEAIRETSGGHGTAVEKTLAVPNASLLLQPYFPFPSVRKHDSKREKRKDTTFHWIPPLKGVLIIR